MRKRRGHRLWGLVGEDEERVSQARNHHDEDEGTDCKEDGGSCKEEGTDRRGCQS